MNEDDEAKMAEMKRRVTKAVEELSEFCDCVHIFAQTHEGGEDGGTYHCVESRGNFFARYGQIKHWIITEEETTKCKSRKADAAAEE